MKGFKTETIFGQSVKGPQWTREILRVIERPWARSPKKRTERKNKMIKNRKRWSRTALENKPTQNLEIRMVQFTSQLSYSFNPPPLGGQILPPCRIFSIAQKRRQISTRNFQYLPQHQFDVCQRNFRKLRREIFEKMAF